MKTGKNFAEKNCGIFFCGKKNGGIQAAIFVIAGDEAGTFGNGLVVGKEPTVAAGEVASRLASSDDEEEDAIAAL